MKRFFRFEYVRRLLLSSLVVNSLFLMGGDAARAQSTTNNAPPPGNVDINLSRVIMWVGKTGLGHDHAVMGSLKSGQVTLGAQANAGSLVFDMTSFDADGPDARKYVGLKGETDANTRRQVNENMHNASILNTAKFPTATFQIDSAVPAPQSAGVKAGSYLLKGKFTLVGVSRPLELTCEVVPHGNQQRLRTGFVLKQTDYGITPFSKALGAVGVANEMKVFGEIVISAHQR